MNYTFESLQEFLSESTFGGDCQETKQWFIVVKTRSESCR